MAKKARKIGKLPAARKARAYHHGSLEDALVRAALDLIARRGAQALSLREVARLAGVSQAAPYRHFASKEALLAAVAEEGFRQMAREMEEATAPWRSDPVRSLEELGLAYVRFAATHRAHFRVMFGPEIAAPGRYPGLEEAGRISFGKLLSAVESLQACGKAPSGAPLDLAIPAWGLVQGLSQLLIDGRLPGVSPAAGEFPKEAESLVRASARRLLGGLGGP